VAGTAPDTESCPASFAILIGRFILATATQTLHRNPSNVGGVAKKYTSTGKPIPDSFAIACDCTEVTFIA
jgi:hypothetical protein